MEIINRIRDRIEQYRARCEEDLEVLDRFSRKEYITYKELISRFPQDHRYMEVLKNIPKFQKTDKFLAKKCINSIVIKLVPEERFGASLIIVTNRHGIEDMGFEQLGCVVR